MTIKHIVTYVDNDEACATRIRYAAELAAISEAHVTGVYRKRELLVPVYASAHVPAQVLVQYDEMSSELADKARDVFETAMHGCNVTFEWQLLDDYVPDALARQMRFADLLVVPQASGEEQDLHEQYDLPNVLTRVPGPVVVVPQKYKVTRPRHHAVVAWNDTRESGLAARASLPLLAAMQRVTVMQVHEEAQSLASGHLLCAQLARHGLDVNFAEQSTSDHGIGDALLAYTAEHECELLVMGAYGHSRFYETMLGGVTRHVLKNAQLPVLMAH